MVDFNDLRSALNAPNVRRFLNESLEESKIGAAYGFIMRGEIPVGAWSNQIINDANSMRLAALGEAVGQITGKNSGFPAGIQKLFNQVQTELPDFRQKALHDKGSQEITGEVIQHEMTNLLSALKKTSSVAGDLTPKQKEFLSAFRKYAEQVEIITAADIADPKVLQEALKDAANFREIRTLTKVQDAVATAFPKDSLHNTKLAKELFGVDVAHRNDLAHEYIWSKDGPPAREYAGRFVRGGTLDTPNPYQQLLDINKQSSKAGVSLFTGDQLTGFTRKELKNIVGEDYAIHSKLNNLLGAESSNILSKLSSSEEKSLYAGIEVVLDSKKSLYEVLEKMPAEHRAMVIERIADMEPILSKNNPEITKHIATQLTDSLSKFKGAVLSENLTAKISAIAEKAEELMDGAGISLLEQIDSIKARTTELLEKVGGNLEKILPALKIGAKILPAAGLLFTAPEALAKSEEAHKALERGEITQKQYDACRDMYGIHIATGATGNIAGVALEQKMENLAGQANIPTNLRIQSTQENLGMSSTHDFSHYTKTDGTLITAAEMKEQIKSFLSDNDSSKYPAAGALYKIALVQGLSEADAMQYLRSEETRSAGLPPQQSFPLNSPEKWKELRDGLSIGGFLDGVLSWVTGGDKTITTPPPIFQAANTQQSTGVPMR